MRLKFILNAPVQLESGGTCVACLGGSPCCHLCRKGFSQVADWLEVQWLFIVKFWALAEVAELWAG